MLADKSTADLRLQAALALGEFTQIDGVLARLSAVCLAQDESIDLATRRSHRSSEPDPRVNASRCCGRCRATKHWGALPEVCCRRGTSNSALHERKTP